MLTLYDYLPSRNAWKVRQLLHHLQRPFRQVLVSIFEGEGRSPAFLRINPSGRVPAIELEDGRTLAESNAILAYLADGTPYLPTEAYDRARVHQWLSFEQEQVESVIGALRHWTLTGKLSRQPPELVARKRATGERSLGLLDAELATRPFIAGARYTIADISVYAYASLSGDAGFPLGRYPNVLAWTARVEAQARFLAQSWDYSIDPHASGDLPG